MNQKAREDTKNSYKYSCSIICTFTTVEFFTHSV